MKAKELDLYQIAEKVHEFGQKWAEKKQMSDHKDRFSKVLLSQLVLDFKSSEQGKISQIELERKAYASNDWQMYLKEWKEAEGETLKAKVTYEAWANLFTAKMDELATKRRTNII